MASKTGFFVISTQLGGAERSLLELLTELRKKKAPMHVYTPLDKGPLIDELDLLEIPWTSLNWPQTLLSLSRKRLLTSLISSLPAALSFAGIIRDTTEIIKRDQLTHVHSTGLKFHILFNFIANKMPDVQFILHIRDLIGSPPLKALLEWGGPKKNVRFISNSQITAQALAPLQSKVIYNGFAMESGSSSNLKKQLHLSDSIPLVGIVAAIARWKGQREFIEMASLIAATHEQVHFVIVGSEIYDTYGDKGELDRLKEKVHSLGMEKRILFLPFQKDVASVYKGLDVLVHASIAPEPFGRVIVESMVAGCPVTASGSGGPTEIIEPMTNGLLHSPGNPRSMADNVLRLLDSPDLRSKISENGRHRARDFSMEKHVQAMSAEFDLS